MILNICQQLLGIMNYLFSKSQVNVNEQICWKIMNNNKVIFLRILKSNKLNGLSITISDYF